MKTILDDKKKGEICGILAVGGTYAMAAKRVGCSRMTIWRAANRDPEFRKRMYRAQTRPEKTFLNTISRAAKETRYWSAARWALQHMYPDRYARRPLTMRLSDVKNLISQILHGITEVVPDQATRAAIRRRLRQMTSEAVEKCKQDHREKARLAIATNPYDPNWPKDKGPPNTGRLDTRDA
jgi:hypothetical protein